MSPAAGTWVGDLFMVQAAPHRCSALTMRQNLPNGQNRRFLGTIHQWQLYFIWSINLFLPNIYSFHFNCQSGGQYLNGKVGLDWMASQILIWEILIPVPSPPWHINHGTLGSGIIHWGPSLHWRPCLLCNWCSLLGTKLKGNIFGCFMIALGWKNPSDWFGITACVATIHFPRESPVHG